MDDRLSDLFQRFPVRAGVFYAGPLCGVYDFERETKPGHLHFVRAGAVELIDASAGSQRIAEPSVVFMPDAATHRIVADAGTEVLCSTARFDSPEARPLVGALPALVVVPLAAAPSLQAVCHAMFIEADGQAPGRLAALNRLCEFCFVALTRHCLAQGLADSGMLAGLADPRLHKALQAMQHDPARDWALQDLAAVAGMSRARFAARFREVVGCTPGEHLSSCRVTLAQTLLRQELRVKQVAERVGYGSASALIRAFTRVTGSRPTRWLELQVNDHTNPPSR